MIDGIKMTFLGTEYIVPPLNLKAVKALTPELSKMNESKNQMEFLPLVGKLVLAALQRNYPDITEDQVEDMIDLGNAETVMKALLGQSGFKSEGEVSGEAKAA